MAVGSNIYLLLPRDICQGGRGQTKFINVSSSLLLRERGEKPRSAGMQGEHWSALVFSLIGDPEVTVPRWKAQDIALGKRLAPLSE